MVRSTYMRQRDILSLVSEHLFGKSQLSLAARGGNLEVRLEDGVVQQGLTHLGGRPVTVGGR